MTAVYILAVIGAVSTCITVCFAALWLYEGCHTKETGRTTANARLIASAPKMYWLLTEMLKVEALKAQASTEKNDPLFMHALVAQESTDNMAKELLAYIDGEEKKV